MFRNVSEYFSLSVWIRTSKSSEKLLETLQNTVLTDFIKVFRNFFGTFFGFRFKIVFWGFRLFQQKNSERCSKIFSENHSEWYPQCLKSLSEQLFWNRFGNVSKDFRTISVKVSETVSENTARTFVTPFIFRTKVVKLVRKFTQDVLRIVVQVSYSV
jgi:hypothetical protein